MRPGGTTLRLFADRPLEDAVREARSILETGVSAWSPFAIYGCFSGGYDSLTACDLAAAHPAFRGCIHVNTRTGVPETSEFVRETCRARGWRLWEYEPDEKNRYEDFVLVHGFPGPGQHNLMYRRLKERALRRFLRERKAEHAAASIRSGLNPDPRARIGLVTGVRKSESQRRKMGRGAAVQKEKGQAWVWIAPLISWSKDEVLGYLEREQLPRNPVVERLGMSGECLCGAFASPGELQRIAKHYPEVADRIAALEEQCRLRGVPCVWDDRPPPGPPVEDPLQLTLCSGCEWRR